MRHQQLTPCPFCGSKEISAFHTVEISAFHTVGDDQVSIQCMKCKCRTKGFFTDDEMRAADVWNTRADKSASHAADTGLAAKLLELIKPTADEARLLAYSSAGHNDGKEMRLFALMASRLERASALCAERLAGEQK